MAHKARTFLEQLRASRAVYLLIYAMMVALLALGILSFFYEPRSKDGVASVIEGFKLGLTGALSFLFGVTIPGGALEPGPGAVMMTCPHCNKQFDGSSQLHP